MHDKSGLWERFAGLDCSRIQHICNASELSMAHSSAILRSALSNGNDLSNAKI